MADERGEKSFLQQRLSACNPPKKNKISIASSHLQSTKKIKKKVQNLLQILSSVYLFQKSSFFSATWQQIYLVFGYVQCFRMTEDE